MLLKSPFSEIFTSRYLPSAFRFASRLLCILFYSFSLSSTSLFTFTSRYSRYSKLSSVPDISFGKMFLVAELSALFIFLPLSLSLRLSLYICFTLSVNRVAVAKDRALGLHYTDNPLAQCSSAHVALRVSLSVFASRCVFAIGSQVTIPRPA